jgi:hypothetical protein
MQTIVVLIAQEPNGDRPQEKQSLRERIEHAAKQNGAPRSVRGENSTPPFWTWFVENPRRHRGL